LQGAWERDLEKLQMGKKRAYEFVLFSLTVLLLIAYAAAHMSHGEYVDGLADTGVITAAGAIAPEHQAEVEKKNAWHYMAIIMAGAGFAFISSLYLLRPKATFTLLGLCLVIGWTAEYIGHTTGLIFGDYYYTDALGWKLGGVPIVIPFAWFMVGYLAYVITNLIIVQTPARRSGFKMVLWLSVITAFIGTSYDLVLDTLLSGKLQAWIWDPKGDYFGVPFHNYIGWWSVLLIISILFRWFQSHNFPRRKLKLSAWAALMPIIAYAMLTYNYARGGEPVETQLISIFALGVPTLIGAWGWYVFRTEYNARADEPKPDS